MILHVGAGFKPAPTTRTWYYINLSQSVRARCLCYSAVRFQPKIFIDAPAADREDSAAGHKDPKNRRRRLPFFMAGGHPGGARGRLSKKFQPRRLGQREVGEASHHRYWPAARRQAGGACRSVFMMAAAFSFTTFLMSNRSSPSTQVTKYCRNLVGFCHNIPINWVQY